MPHIPLVLCVGSVTHLHAFGFRPHLASIVHTYISNTLLHAAPCTAIGHAGSDLSSVRKRVSMVPCPIGATGHRNTTTSVGSADSRHLNYLYYTP